MDEIIKTIVIYALPVIFAITLHEAAHGYAAKHFGDLTAYQQGRISLDPLKHIDPFGTILLPVLLYAVSHGQFLFGYAKPVPVNFGNLRKPKQDMVWVALAGPAANFAMAFAWMLLGFVLQLGGLQAGFAANFFYGMAQAGIMTNLVMMAFNLFPLPPLDGGRILFGLLPHKYAYRFAKLEPYGMFIVMALLYLPMLPFWDLWMAPVMNVAGTALNLLTYPLHTLIG